MGREARAQEATPLSKRRQQRRRQAIADGAINPTNQEVWMLARASYVVLRRPFLGRLKWLLFGK